MTVVTVFLRRYMKGVSFSNKRYTKGVPFLKKMVYKRVRSWTSGRSLHIENFFEYPPPPPPGNKHSWFNQFMRITEQCCGKIDPVAGIQCSRL